MAYFDVHGARQAGYSDEQILKELEQRDPSLATQNQSAQQDGYAPSEIVDYLGQNYQGPSQAQPSSAPQAASPNYQGTDYTHGAPPPMESSWLNANQTPQNDTTSALNQNTASNPSQPQNNPSLLQRVGGWLEHSAPARMLQGAEQVMTGNMAANTESNISAQNAQFTQNLLNQRKQALAAGDTAKATALKQAIVNGMGNQADMNQIATGSDQPIMTPEQEVGAGIGTMGDVAALGTMGAGAELGAAGRIAEGGLYGMGSGVASSMGQNQSAQDVSKSALTGGAAGLATGGLLEGGSAALNKGASALMDNLAARGIRPSPSQMAKFAKTTGMDMKDFIVQNKLFQPGTAQVDQLIAPVQQAFDSLALNKDAAVPANDVVNGLLQRSQELTNDTSPELQQKGNTLNAIAANFDQKYGDSGIPLDVLSAERAKFDKNVNWNNPIDANAETRDVLQNLIRDKSDSLASAGDTSLKDLGRQLHNLYTFRDIADKQQYLGQGSKPIGITKGIAGSIGAGAGALLGGAPGAVVGTGVGAGVENLLNSPRVVGTVARGAQTASQTHLPSALSDMLRRALSSYAGHI